MSIVRKSSPWAALPALCLLHAAGALADNGIGGDETVDNRIVNSNAVWTVLVAEPFALAQDAGSCIATGSADAVNPNNGNNRQYRFALSIDNANPAVDGPFERTQEFDTGATGREEVSSTATFRFLQAGNHTIYWLARIIGGAPALTVADNSMTFVCMNALLDPFDGPGDGGGD
jgi:hypothetical protein